MDDALAGLPLEEALAALKAAGEDVPEVEVSMPPTASAHPQGREARVVRARDGRLLVSYFKTGTPEG